MCDELPARYDVSDVHGEKRQRIKLLRSEVDRLTGILDALSTEIDQESLVRNRSERSVLRVQARRLPAKPPQRRRGLPVEQALAFPPERACENFVSQGSYNPCIGFRARVGFATQYARICSQICSQTPVSETSQKYLK